MKEFVKIAIWFIVVTLLVDLAFSLITMGSTMANLLGFVIVIATIYVSYTTKLFTNIKLKKNEKNN